MALRTFRNNPSIGGFGNESGGGHFMLRQGKQQQKEFRNVPLTSSNNNNNENRNNNHSNEVRKSIENCWTSNRSSTFSINNNDAFVQIVKELVDNAVDACNTSSNCSIDKNGNNETNCVKVLKRVRVSIEEVDSSDSSKNTKDDTYNNKENDDEDCNNLLRVTVADNGCGMVDIESCVSAFSSSKSGGSGIAETIYEPSPTAGRYGIGLTLSLLHAQRLVPDSCTSITSSTPSQSVWTVAKFVVDAERDTVVCVKKQTHEKKKNFRKSSGTTISLLVPGGIKARRAWPRLAEYFARFQLSLGLKCSLQVMAPSLATRPLFIRPMCEKQSKRGSKENELEEEESQFDDCPQDLTKYVILHEKHIDNDEVHDDFDDWINQPTDSETSSDCVHGKSVNKNVDVPISQCDEELWFDGFHDDFEQLEKHKKVQMKRTCQRKEEATTSFKDDESDIDRRILIQAAASSYLEKAIPLGNVASSFQILHLEERVTQRGKKNIPSLSIDMIVCDNEQINVEDEDDCEYYCNEGNNDNIDQQCAKISLIRMFNHIPLLDGAEATACGIVQGIARNHTVWNSFGLDVNHWSKSTHSWFNSKSNQLDTSNLYIPTFSLRDSASVASYFTENRTHTIFEDDESSCSSNEESSTFASGKRKKNKKTLLLPAGLRIGEILIIVQLEANPNELPLPTLSKGRLPINDKAIDDALELGIASCLRSLQTSKPSLFLNANQLKKTERDVRYIPSVAASLTSMILNCQNSKLKDEMMGMTKRWYNDTSSHEHFPIVSIDECDTIKPSNNSLEPLDVTSNIHSQCHNLSATYTNKDQEVMVLERNITSRFREVMNTVKTRKVELAKQAKAEYCRRKKKTAKYDSGSDESSVVEDLDNFLSLQDQRIDEEQSTKSFNENETKDHDSSEDFDDDEWW